jgi:hypothetical protein
MKNKLLVLCITLLIALMQGTLCTVEVKSAPAQEESEVMKCSKPYIKRIKPLTALLGVKVVIIGRRFGKDSGSVIFNSNVLGEIVSWENKRIEVIVPEGAITGNVIVVNSCLTSNTQYFKVKSL